MARERPTASDEQPTVRTRTSTRAHDEVLTRAQARALSRCAPLQHAAGGDGIIARLCKRHNVRTCDDGGTEIGMGFDIVPVEPAGAH